MMISRPAGPEVLIHDGILGPTNISITVLPVWRTYVWHDRVLEYQLVHSMAVLLAVRYSDV